MHILASTLVSALGLGKNAHIDALLKGVSGLSNQTQFHQKIEGITTYLGEVNNLESVELPVGLQDYDCRNNRLAWQALQTDGFDQTVAELMAQCGSHRIGLVMGTSTSGIAATEEVFREEIEPDHYCYEKTQQMDSLSQFCCQALGVQGPSFVISTACSSSAKVFAVAQRWLKADIVDAVVVGGVDTLCLTTLHGFNSLGLVSQKICAPLDESRDGINIGEAGGFMLLGSETLLAGKSTLSVEVVGVGESSDAYHISTPHPEGQGAQVAMKAAMAQAEISIEDIDYINLHGTATPSNDLSEVSGVGHLITPDSQAWMSSTKGFTGHALGAAGITEVMFCQWALENQLVPANLNLVQFDPVLAPKIAQSKISVPRETLQLTDEAPVMNYAMSNSFGFGGNNASVILKRGGA